MSCSSPSVQAGSGAEPRSGAVLDLGGEKAVRPCRPHDVQRQFGVHNALRWALNSKRVQEGSLLQVVPGGGSCKEAGSSSALSTAASAALGAASARSPPQNALLTARLLACQPWLQEAFFRPHSLQLRHFGEVDGCAVGRSGLLCRG